jgi:hypothetical protein
MKFNDFYNQYIDWGSEHNMKCQGKIVISKILRQYKINLITGTSNILYINEKHSNLLLLFKSKNWISELDQYDEGNKTVVDNLSIDDENIRAVLADDILGKKLFEILKKKYCV